MLAAYNAAGSGAPACPGCEGGWKGRLVRPSDVLLWLALGDLLPCRVDGAAVLGTCWEALCWEILVSDAKEIMIFMHYIIHGHKSLQSMKIKSNRI